MSRVLRYIYDNFIREDFIDFLDVQDKISGSIEEQLVKAKIVLKRLNNLNLDLENCVGITTDGCSVMILEICGAFVNVQSEAMNAVYCPCYNHKLNLSISKSSTVQTMGNTIAIMKKVITFFNVSVKRSRLLKTVMRRQLSTVCETR